MSFILNVECPEHGYKGPAPCPLCRPKKQMRPASETGADGPDIDWNNLRTVQYAITNWASTRFPNRTYHAALSKLVLQEIPEMLQYYNEHGTSGIGEELADCFILLMDLATLWNVDLPIAIRRKMTINYERRWKVDPMTGIAQHVEDSNDHKS